MFVSLTLILGFGTMSSAVAHAVPTDGPGAIPMSEADFVAGAVKYAGLTASEAHAAYADPEAIATVPVQVSTQVGSSAAPSRDSGSSAEVNAPAVIDCEVTALQTFENVFGHDLAYYELNKWFEAEDGRVVGTSTSWRGWASDLGYLGGWAYRGNLVANTGWRGPDYTEHFSQVVGDFADYNDAHWTPEIEIAVHGEGSYEVFLPGSDQEYYLSHCSV
ncbi:hypothetical protein AB1046_08705 [Promicromonospora sp. Populi]|uniref:hypothetical protein n=1 Tax=Promicromonospora sp. Populi TaxID=3239420 RepID=UPI0034E296B4